MLANVATLKVAPDPNDEFEKLLFAVVLEVQYAKLHLDFARKIAKAAEIASKTLERAPVFFAFTFRAHLESAYLRAARLFDSQPDTIRISEVIQMAGMKAGKFKSANASEVRQKITAWKADIAIVDPLLKNLRDLRNSLIAHLESVVVLDPNEIARVVAVNFDDISKILGVADKIVRGVLRAYNNAAFVDQLYTADDCDLILGGA